MKKVLLGVIFGCLLLGATAAYSAPVTIINQGDSWQYSTLSQDLWPVWNTFNYGSIGWGSLAWSNGNAAFGSAGGLSHNTYWGINTDLALQKQISVNGIFNGSLTLNAASDNGFAVFINGLEVVRQNAEGYTSYWEYSFAVNPNVFIVGVNTIQVVAEDHGGSSFFDMKLSGDLQPVPEPSTLLLFGAGLAGLGAYGLRKRV